MELTKYLSALVIVCLLFACQDDARSDGDGAPTGSPGVATANVQENPLKEAYFGETHIHTGVSMDAFIAGNRLTPDDAYRFAQGEAIMVNGSMHRIKRPLDFIAVTDHSEFMGESIQRFNDRVFKKVNFVRYGLDRGLKYKEDLGVNPFKYGFVGGTDSHNGSPGNVEEDNWEVGGHGLADQTAEDRATRDMDGELSVADMSPGALAAVWATSNTREAIWDAMYAKETFATSGPRMKVRAFAGQGFQSSYDSYGAMLTDGYSKGVPMGGDYEGGEAPQILVWAIKDPIGPNLDRIQIIKGWVENGEMKDRVFNVVASGDRLRADGTVEPIDAPINLETAAFNTEKGSAELMGVWTDPDFDPEQQAYYYTRVLQLPTARWNLYDEIRHGVEFPDDVKKQIVERAWGSPIWYEPKYRFPKRLA